MHISAGIVEISGYETSSLTMEIGWCQGRTFGKVLIRSKVKREREREERERDRQTDRQTETERDIGREREGEGGERKALVLGERDTTVPQHVTSFLFHYPTIFTQAFPWNYTTHLPLHWRPWPLRWPPAPPLLPWQPPTYHGPFPPSLLTSSEAHPNRTFSYSTEAVQKLFCLCNWISSLWRDNMVIKNMGGGGVGWQALLF